MNPLLHQYKAALKEESDLLAQGRYHKNIRNKKKMFEAIKFLFIAMALLAMSYMMLWIISKLYLAITLV